MIAETAKVREQHRFDVAALERYLRDRVAGFSGPLEVSQFRGGQSNPTYHLRAGAREYVLRRKPPGKLLPSAHAVDREYRVITALGRTAVPVPRTFVLCEDDTVIGTAFFVMDCVHGRVFSDPALPGATPAERAAMYDSMNDVLARLHTVDAPAIGLGDFGRPGNYFSRQIHRWTTQYRASETERIEAMERLIAAVAERSGWHTVRGSSSNGGKQALKQMVEHLKKSGLAGHILDGPRGPAGEVKPGIISMAHSAEAAIVPFYTNANRSWFFKSWDDFFLPKPFARVTISFGEPIILDKTEDEGVFETQRSYLEKLMRPG